MSLRMLVCPNACSALTAPTGVLACLTACAPASKPETKALEPAAQRAAVAGQKFQHDGVELYYEVYGSGEPLLLIHGNGGSSRDFAAQIAHFRNNYQVIAMDSRDQVDPATAPGRSPTRR